MLVEKRQWGASWNPIEGKMEYGVTTQLVREHALVGVTYNGMPLFPSAVEVIEPSFYCDHDEYVFWDDYEDEEPYWEWAPRLRRELAALPRLVSVVPNQDEWHEVY